MKLKYLISLVLLISFVSLGIFGLAVFSHSSDHSSSNCLAYTIEGVVCSFSVFQNLSKALILSVFDLFSIPISVLIVAILIYWLFFNPLFSKFNINFSGRKLLRWLALFEHSPSA